MHAQPRALPALDFACDRCDHPDYGA
jgi:hypothetical protein